jgi:deoxyribose-phosphate aldolase
LTDLPTTRAELARFIDHTLLKPEATAADIERLCSEGREYGFFAVCVNPIWVPRCVELLRGSQTRVASVAGFPLGASATPVKALEARLAVEQGAAEVDMVVNLAALLAGDKRAVVRDIAAVVAAVKGVNADALVKVILETRALTTTQMVLGCRCVAEAQADFVKTSTGFHPAGGATVEHVALLHRHIAPLPVKAAGGIRTRVTALAMIEAGAARLGMSTSVAVLRDFRA